MQPPSAQILALALDHTTDGVMLFDGEWTIRYVNAVAAALLGGPASELTGRNYFNVLPDAAGTFWHDFLLRARDSDEPVSWRGYFERTGRWFTATVRPLGEDLWHLSFRQDPPEATGLNDNAGRRRPDEVGDRARLRYLADVSETLSSTVDVREAVRRLAGLVVPRLADWALVAVLDEHGRADEQAWVHHDAAAQRDLDAYMSARTPSPTASFRSPARCGRVSRCTSRT